MLAKVSTDSGEPGIEVDELDQALLTIGTYRLPGRDRTILGVDGDLLAGRVNAGLKEDLGVAKADFGVNCIGRRSEKEERQQEAGTEMAPTSVSHGPFFAGSGI